MLLRFLTYVCSLSFSLVASRGVRGCYRDSWQHHGPAFVAWPVIVFLVLLQSTARSILPRSRTATSASFAASYFTGAQHGVARYLGNFAERGCSLCQQPVPRRQRIRRCRASSSLLLSFLLSIAILSLSPLFFRTLFVALVSSSFLLNKDHAFARTCILVYPRSSSSFLLSCCSYLFFLPTIPSVSVLTSLYASLLLSVFAFVLWRSRSSCTHVSISHRAHRL